MKKKKVKERTLILPHLQEKAPKSFKLAPQRNPRFSVFTLLLQPNWRNNTSTVTHWTEEEGKKSQSTPRENPNSPQIKSAKNKVSEKPYTLSEILNSSTKNQKQIQQHKKCKSESKKLQFSRIENHEPQEHPNSPNSTDKFSFLSSELTELKSPRKKICQSNHTKRNS